MIDFYAKERHFRDHLRPIFDRLVETGHEARWIERKGKSDAKSKFAVVASYGDLQRATADGKLVFFAEHGAGQSYTTRNPSYAGGPNRQNVCMFLSPGPHVTAKNRLYYPEIPSAEVGVPKLDKRHAVMQKEPREMPAVPTVCFSFHWDCTVCPETRSGFKYFREAVIQAKQSGEFDVIGHCHPRAVGDIKPFYDSYEIEFVEDFEDVMDRADVYVCDNSSTIFEFASIGKPVVLLNPPIYRKFVNHGLRFWEYASLGPQAHNTGEVLSGIREALNDTEDVKKYRDSLISKVYYAMDGRAAERAADAILEYIEEMTQVENSGNVLRCKRTAMGMFGILDPGQTVLIYPTFAIVNDVHGRFRRRVPLPGYKSPDERIRILLKTSSLNYELVEPDPALLKEPEEDFSRKGKDFVPADKTLTKAELFIIQGIDQGLSKSKIVYKSKSEFGVAALQRAWDRLESDAIIVPGEKQFTWEVRKWGQY